MSSFLFDFLVSITYNNTMDESNGKEKYYAYLQTDIWQKIRTKVLQRDLGRCRVCNSRKELNVHHRIYPKVYGEESLIDLVTLCHKCHELFHFKSTPTKSKPRKPSKAKINNVYLRRAKYRLSSEGIGAKGNIQSVAKVICKNKGIVYPKKGKRNKENCLEIIKEYLNKPFSPVKAEPGKIFVRRSILRKGNPPPQ